MVLFITGKLRESFGPRPRFDTFIEAYQLRILTLMFHESSVYLTSEGPEEVTFYYLSWSSYILFISFFSLVNSVGAVIGYWLSKATFMKKLLEKRKQKT